MSENGSLAVESLLLAPIDRAVAVHLCYVNQIVCGVFRATNIDCRSCNINNQSTHCHRWPIFQSPQLEAELLMTETFSGI